jgi:Rrf2 family protein
MGIHNVASIISSISDETFTEAPTMSVGCSDTCLRLGTTMKLSRTLAYSLCAMIYLARSEQDVPVPCNVIARSGNMPERFLLQILRGLVNHGLLRSARGVDGGYCLARPPQDITLYDIVETSLHTREPDEGALGALKPGARDRVLTALERADRVLRLELQKLTLAELVHATG